LTRLRVALTGGIGSGKSTVSRLLASYGAVVIDSDVLAREVVAPGTPGLAAVVAEFGPGVLAADGSLDRPALGSVVFADPAARARLEAIVHPLVRSRARELEAAAASDAVVVHDIPLLVETGRQGRYDVVLVVDTPTQAQRDRLTELRELSVEEAERRIGAQASRAERLAAADHVIRNDGTLDDLAEQVERLWRSLVGRA